MSRIEKRNDRYTIQYGIDDIEGLFIRIFDDSLKDEPFGDIPVLDMSKKRNADLTLDEIVETAEEYGFNLSDELSEETII